MAGNCAEVAKVVRRLVNNRADSFSAVNRDEYLPRFLLNDMLAAGAALLACTFAMGLVRGRVSASDSVRLAASTLLVSSR